MQQEAATDTPEGGLKSLAYRIPLLHSSSVHPTQQTDKKLNQLENGVVTAEVPRLHNHTLGSLFFSLSSDPLLSRSIPFLLLLPPPPPLPMNHHSPSDDRTNSKT